MNKIKNFRMIPQLIREEMSLKVKSHLDELEYNNINIEDSLIDKEELSKILGKENGKYSDFLFDELVKAKIINEYNCIVCDKCNSIVSKIDPRNDFYFIREHRNEPEYIDLYKCLKCGGRETLSVDFVFRVHTWF